MHAPFEKRFTNRLFAAMAGLKVLAIALMAMVFVEGAQTFEAVAQEAPTTCGGKNLLTELKNSDPDAHANVLSEAAGVLHGEGLLWKIEKEGTPASYLYGTMHMSDPRTARLAPGLKTALDAVESVAVENTDALDPAKSQTAMIKFQSMTLNLDGVKLEERFPEEVRPKLREFLAARNLPNEVADLFQPWMVSAMMAIPTCEMAMKQAEMPVLDAVIANTAKAEDKSLISLETMEEQFSAISSISLDFQLASIRDLVERGVEGADDINETMKLLYLDEKIGVLMPLLGKLSPDVMVTEGATEFMEELIDKRNAVMAKRSKPLLEKGKVLIAVGALHLPGEKGLVQMFKDSGFNLTPVKAF